MSSRLHITLATTALALMFSANPFTAKSPAETRHCRPSSDRRYREHDIHCSPNRRCCEVRLRDCGRLLHI